MAGYPRDVRELGADLVRSILTIFARYTILLKTIGRIYESPTVDIRLISSLRHLLYQIGIQSHLDCIANN